MGDMIDVVIEKLSLFEKMYDIVRIVDPVKKKVIAIKDNESKDIDDKCYALYKKKSCCCNCISMRAYNEKNTFVKIEYCEEKIYLIIATPVNIGAVSYVVEIVKDISDNGNVFQNYSERGNEINDLVGNINKKVSIDEITGIYNERYIGERLPVDTNNSMIFGQPLSVIMASIDMFSSIKNEHGQIVASSVLKDFINIIKCSIRKNTDWIAKCRGGEILIVLNNTGTEGACRVAEKIRLSVEKASFIYGNTKIKLTSSFGVYSTENQRWQTQEILKNVDRNLFAAIKQGGNRTISADINPEENQLIHLNERIEEFREALDEMCLTKEENVDVKQKLQLSQYLDELIVEYMKQNKIKNDSEA
jgi:two-component system, cell cycle response regulator